MSRLAIADPPYLGRAHRWYGVGGRGSGAGRGRADEHPDARVWDDPQSHRALIDRLCAEYDGWAVAAAATSLAVYLAAAPADVRVMIWHRRNAAPSGSRIQESWEPVIVRVPKLRTARGTGPAMRDVLDAGSPRIGFTGAKPESWTRWVLDALGYDPELDTIDDLFSGSGAVARAVRVQVLL